MTSNIKKIAAGFTLVETLVAVLILSVAIAGPLTIAARGLNAALISKDQITAFYLAQDAVEYVRFKRDTYTLCIAAGQTTGSCAGATSWLGSGAGTLSLCTSPSGAGLPNACYIDSRANTITQCSAGNCSNALKYNSSSGANYYTYTAGSNVANTIFKRSVKITNPLNGKSDEAQLTVVITWNDVGGTSHNVTVTENLLNWQ